MKNIYVLTAAIILASSANLSAQESAAQLTIDTHQMTGWIENTARHASNFIRPYETAKTIAKERIAALGPDDPEDEFLEQVELAYVRLVALGNTHIRNMVQGLLDAIRHNTEAKNQLRLANQQPQTAVGQARAATALRASRAAYNKARKSLSVAGAELFNWTMIINELNNFRPEQVNEA